MIPGIRWPENLNLNLRFKSVTRSGFAGLTRVAVGIGGWGGYPLGLLGKVFVSPVISSS